jgi:hypothetical protein
MARALLRWRVKCDVLVPLVVAYPGHLYQRAVLPKPIRSFAANKPMKPTAYAGSAALKEY